LILAAGIPAALQLEKYLELEYQVALEISFAKGW
jgi:hypothetical protein